MSAPVMAEPRWPLGLMAVHVDTLFTRDAEGRLLRVNDPSGAPAPRFFLGRVDGGNVLEFGATVDVGCMQELSAAVWQQKEDRSIGEPQLDSARFEGILNNYSPVRRVYAGPAFRFPAELPRAPSTVRITTANTDLLRPHLGAWIEDIEIGRPAMAVVVDGAAVAICCSVRLGSSAHEAGVETVASHRGRGYGVDVVSAWATLVREMRITPMYSTSWDNLASRALARRLRLEQYGADLHFT